MKTFLLSFFILGITILKAQPINDWCSNAVSVNLNSSGSGAASSGETVYNATQTISPSSCSGYASSVANDVWFKFTAERTQQHITVCPSSGLDAVVEVRTAACFGSSLGCIDNGGGAGACEYLTVNTTIGTEYLIRVYDYTGSNTPPTSFNFDLGITGSGGTNSGGTGGGTGISLDPDLIITNQTVSSSSAYPGDNVTADCLVTIISGSCDNTELEYWWSLDPILTSDDLSLGTDGVHDLDANGDDEDQEDKPFTVPNVNPGTYYVLFEADSDDEVVESNESNNVSYAVVNVLGYQSPEISVPSSLDFGVHYYGNGGAVRPLTITNTGNATLNIYGLDFPTYHFGPDWNGAIAPGQSQTINIAYNPSIPSNSSGVMTINSNAVSGNSNINVTANSVASSFELHGDLDFGQVPTGYSITKTISIENTGDLDLTVYDLNVPYGFSGSFSGVLLPNEIIDVDITFQPSAQTAYDALLTVNSNATFTVDDMWCEGSGIDAIPFDLNDNGLSHLYWPFPNNSNYYDRKGWKAGKEVNSNLVNFGLNSHVKGDYYAQDWKRYNLGLTCNKEFYAPISGTIIYADDNCGSHCNDNTGNASHTCNHGYGNQVVIQSYIDNDYAFRVSHLNSVNVSTGDFVELGDLIGEMGSTGNSEGAHAHCVLYKNINTYKSIWNGTAKQVLETGAPVRYQNITNAPNEFAANFLFDAQIGSGGSNNDSIPIVIDSIPQITGIQNKSLQGVSIYPNPSRGLLNVILSREFGDPQIEIINLQGQSLDCDKVSNNTFDVSGLPSGIYLVVISSKIGTITTRFVKSE